ncbi:MAG TPA: tetratricopeptide repeat protein [Micropepsaceae bacterium]|nr:tetratricopeptide repeat protein [Micropepsaceae bacterium]
MSKSRIENRQGPVSSVQSEFNKALVLHQLGQLAEAERAYRAILKSYHRHFDAAHLLGLILLQSGQAEAAERQLGRALSFVPKETNNPNVAEAYNNRGLALMKLRRVEEALASFDRGIVVKPDHIDVLANRGAALQELGRADEALATLDAVIAMQPRLAAVHNNRGKALSDLRRFEEALATFDRAIALQPDYPEAFQNRGLTQLLLGEFAQGWEGSEHRWRTPDFQNSGQLALWVKRGDLQNKRVLVVAEQGVGDEIMFASVIPDLVRDAKSVTLECDPRLSGLFARSFPGVGIIDRKLPAVWKASDFDLLLPAGSLGRLYRNAREDFPVRKSYLIPNPEITAKWKARLSNLGGDLKIGISWKGGTEKTRRQARSIPLELWQPLFAIKGVSFISLQYGTVKDEIAAANRLLSRPITCFEPREIDDFDQLAGLVSSLDLIITVQTTLVHLSGAIGQACRVLVPSTPEWRYGLKDNHMAWYSSVRLYRQAKPAEWGETIDRVAADLKSLSEGSDAR